jgi:hypothetical protein
VADPTDLLGAWKDLSGQVQKLAGSLAGQVPKELRDPLTRQAELIESIMRRQNELEQELVRRALAPAQAAADALDKAPDGMRAQAAAFRAAASSFNQAAELLDVQAAALEQTLGAFKAPVNLGRSLRGRSEKPADEG